MNIFGLGLSDDLKVCSVFSDDIYIIFKCLCCFNQLLVGQKQQNYDVNNESIIYLPTFTLGHFHCSIF